MNRRKLLCMMILLFSRLSSCTIRVMRLQGAHDFCGTDTEHKVKHIKVAACNVQCMNNKTICSAINFYHNYADPDYGDCVFVGDGWSAETKATPGCSFYYAERPCDSGPCDERSHCFERLQTNLLGSNHQCCSIVDGMCDYRLRTFPNGDILSQHDKTPYSLDRISECRVECMAEPLCQSIEAIKKKGADKVTCIKYRNKIKDYSDLVMQNGREYNAKT